MSKVKPIILLYRADKQNTLYLITTCKRLYKCSTMFNDYRHPKTIKSISVHLIS